MAFTSVERTTSCSCSGCQRFSDVAPIFFGQKKSSRNIQKRLLSFDMRELITIKHHKASIKIKRNTHQQASTNINKHQQTSTNMIKTMINIKIIKKRLELRHQGGPGEDIHSLQGLSAVCAAAGRIRPSVSSVLSLRKNEILILSSSWARNRQVCQ